MRGTLLGGKTAPPSLFALRRETLHGSGSSRYGLWALSLPAPISQSPTDISIQMSAQEQKPPIKLEKPCGRLADGEALKMGQALHSVVLFRVFFVVFSFFLLYNVMQTGPRHLQLAL